MGAFETRRSIGPDRIIVPSFDGTEGSTTEKKMPRALNDFLNRVRPLESCSSAATEGAGEIAAFGQNGEWAAEMAAIPFSYERLPFVLIAVVRRLLRWAISSRCCS
jgi:hypothetical protein